MDENDGVRTRLTHSHEVANLARSIGTRVYKRESSPFGRADLHDDVQPILSAIGLAHDLGNPPFGHQGEIAIGQWFKAREAWIFTRAQKGGDPLSEPVPEDLWPEFTKFDGNPQSLRLITKLQTSNYNVGLDLTAATLAASLKYPVHVRNCDPTKAAKKKAGYFESERALIDWVRAQTGLGEGERHPLTWIMEACDDIAYCVLDVDDLLKKEIISPDDVLVILKHTPRLRENTTVKRTDKRFSLVNQDDRRAEIRRDIKIGYLRAFMFEALIEETSDTFSTHSSDIFGLVHETPLMEHSPLCDALKGVAAQYGFSHSTVLRTEALGAVAIEELMSDFWNAIHSREKTDDIRSRREGARARYVYSLISPNYLEQAHKPTSIGVRYSELRLLTDMVSGMTDTFAIKVWRDLKAIPYASSS
jgi:dGTPase